MYRHHDPNAGADNNYLSATSAASPFPNHLQSPLYSLDPRLQTSPQHLHPGVGVTSHPGHHHVRSRSNESLSSMQPPASVSPRLNSRATPVRGSPSVMAYYRPSDRSLPPKNVSADSITDAYVAFILYCNPNFPLDVDTETLRTTFQNLPKSDSKDFEIFHLYELLKKFHSKEIKTWAQLALDLGVEAPDVSKGQSVQKVQQYSVRLKRWMRAMHIDAFFEFLRGKQHAYFNEVPPPNDPYPATGRDGVMAEEDLAIRALDPSFRPKRGRRRNSETERDEESESNKQQRLDPHDPLNSAYPASAVPLSAHPDGGFSDPWASAASAINPHSFAPWGNRSGIPQSAMSTTAPTNLRWQLGQTPITPHPMTAQPMSMVAHIEAAFDDEAARSAMTPSSSSRKRRRNGPVVSSAWPSANGPGAKPRGRPPASRTAQDGPFSTFPADPSSEKGRPATPETIPEEDIEPMPLPPPAPATRNTDNSNSGRPGRLSLQVPQHTGGPVRLATPPPPKLLVNGEINNDSSDSSSRTPINPSLRKQRTPANMQAREREIPGFAFETLKRVLTSDMLRATLIGRRQRLLGEEAKQLADAVLERLGVPRKDTDIARDNIARLTAASWLGLGEQLNVPLGPATSQGKTVSVTRFRTDREGYEEIVSAHEEVSSPAAGDLREIFDISWTSTLGLCSGKFEIKGLTLGNPGLVGQAKGLEEGEEDWHDALLSRCMNAARDLSVAQGDEALRTGMRRAVEMKGCSEGGGGGIGSDGIDWMARTLAMEFGVQVVKGEMKRMKDRIMQAVLDAVM